MYVMKVYLSFKQDTHDPFDINKYGSLLIGSLKKESNTAFKEVVKAKKTYEISRIFLASLMLVSATVFSVPRCVAVDKNYNGNPYILRSGAIRSEDDIMM